MLLGTLIVYLVVLLTVGVLAERRTRDETDFLLGGRRAGALVAAVGASASSSSAWTLLGVSGAAYGWGMSAVWLFPACVGGFALNWFVLAPALRRESHESGVMSVPDVLAGRPGSPGRGPILALAAFIILVSLGAYVASQFQGAGKTFHAVFEVPVWQAVLTGSAVILVYTMLGGFLAVSVTDTIQGLVMAATALALPLAAFVHVGGLEGLTQKLAALGKDGYLDLGGPRPAILGTGFALGLLGIGLGYPGQPHVVKYFMAMRQHGTGMRDARRIALGWAVVVYGGMILLGLCGRAMFPELDDREVVLVQAAEALFHPVVAGVMLAAVLSAMMSTADSQLLVASGTVTHDAGLGRTPSGHVSLWRSRGTVLLLTVGAALAALFGSERIFERVLFGWGAMGAAFGPLLIVRAVLRRRIRPHATFAVMLTGFVLSAGAHSFYDRLFEAEALKNVAVHVVPFLVALSAAVVASSPAPRSGDGPPRA
jgi:sodium/proline symporter